MVQDAVPYEILDEKLLCSAKVSGPDLHIILPGGGYHRIHTLIFPSIRILGKEPYEKPLKFAEKDGSIICPEESLCELFTGKSIGEITFTRILIQQSFRKRKENLFRTADSFL